MTDRTDDYVALLTSEHRQQPHFQAVVRALTRGFADLTVMLEGLPSLYDLDTAVGNQLDTLGYWVGIDRRVPIPIPNTFFAWDGTVATGWDVGAWKGEFDATTGLTAMSDAEYRIAIKAKISANHWDGTWQQAHDILDALYGAGKVYIFDSQDMNVQVYYRAADLTAVQIALLTNNIIPLRGEGIGVTYTAI